MNQSKGLFEAAVASAGLSLLSEATSILDGHVPNQSKRGRPVRERYIPLRFRDSTSDSSTTPPAPTRTSHAPTKRKSSSMHTSNAKSRIRPQRKSPPESLADPANQNRRSRSTDEVTPPESLADPSNQNRRSRSTDEVTVSAPSQASTEIETNFRRLVDGEPQTNKKPPVSKADSKIRADIVDTLGTELHKYKLTLGNTRKEQYGADRAFFKQRRHFYGDWLNLETIKSATRRYKKKHDISTVTPRPMGDSNSLSSSSQPPSSVD